MRKNKTCKKYRLKILNFLPCAFLHSQMMRSTYRLTVCMPQLRRKPRSPYHRPLSGWGDLETEFNTTDPPDKTLNDTAVPEPPIEDRENTVVKTSSPSDQLPCQHPDELFASAPIQHLVRMKKGTRRKKLTPIISSLTKSISRNYYST